MGRKTGGEGGSLRMRGGSAKEKDGRNGSHLRLRKPVGKEQGLLNSKHQTWGGDFRKSEGHCSRQSITRAGCASMLERDNSGRLSELETPAFKGVPALKS